MKIEENRPCGQSILILYGILPDGGTEVLLQTSKTFGIAEMLGHNVFDKYRTPYTQLFSVLVLVATSELKSLLGQQ